MEITANEGGELGRKKKAKVIKYGTEYIRKEKPEMTNEEKNYENRIRKEDCKHKMKQERNMNE